MHKSSSTRPASTSPRSSARSRSRVKRTSSETRPRPAKSKTAQSPHSPTARRSRSRVLTSTIDRTSSPDQKPTLRTIFNQTVLIFTIGCIFGTYYEEILTLVKTFFTSGTIAWFSRSGLVYGPFSPIYGVGAVGIYLIFYRHRASWPVCLLVGGFLGGAFEFLMSLLQEWIFDTRSWDYSDRFLNIAGRTTVPYMFFWGLLVVIVAKWLLPLLDRLYQRLAGHSLDLFCTILAIFLLFDIAMSIAANIRQTERREGDVPTNAVETFLDNEFPDSRLEEIYENTEPIDQDTAE